jgi:hypothetical protein
LLDHVRQNCFDGVHHAQKIDVNYFGPGSGSLFQEWSDGTLDGCRADQNVDSSVIAAHAIHGGAELFEIRDIGANPESVAAGMFNFEVRQIQFAFAACQQSHLGSGGRESKGQPFADTTAGTRD